MLLFGHIGLTTGAVYLVSRFTSVPEEGEDAQSIKNWNQSETKDKQPRFFPQNMDYRLLAAGSLLPDIIDKPVGELLLGNGRIFCHTLVFAILLTLSGYVLYRKTGRIWLLILATGTIFHTLLDEMWRDPHTLLWPLFGFEFPRYEVDITGWLQSLLYGLHHEPMVFISEALGLAVLAFFTGKLIHRKQILAFLKKGTL